MTHSAKTRLVSLFGAAATLVVFTACGETTVNAPLAAGSVAQVSTTTLTGVVGQPLPNPVSVRVLGTDNQPLPGVVVTFSAAGTGAAVDPATATTDNAGVASTRWTLSRTAGASSLTATVTGGVAGTINATGTAGAAAAITSSAGNNQTAIAGVAVATPPSVRVDDAYGNPVAGASVTFSVLTGAGTVTDFLKVTNASGVAAVGSWTLGSSAGVQNLLARVDATGAAGNTVLFTATATAGAANKSSANSASPQSGTVGTDVASAPSVKVTDANGNAVANVAVTFSVTSGGGVLTAPAQTTNAQGVATVGSWRLGTAPGANSVTAAITGAPNVVFTATGNAGAATQIVVSVGNNQTAQINKAVAVAPAVLARDAFGNPVPGVVVNFAVASGGGVAVSSRQTTDATGVAAVGAWFLGSTPGANTLTASSTGLAAVTFTATADPGLPTLMTANSPTTQTAVAGAIVAQAPSVLVRDAGGNPVAGVIVSFAVTGGGGAVVGSPVTTGVNGVATVTSWTLGAIAGANTVVATSPGIPDIVFAATGTAGAPANVVAFAGTAQVAVQGNAVAVKPAVRVIDANGNAVPGATVTFAVTDGGGTITGAVQTTNATGVATIGSWTLGNGVTNNVLTATVAGAGVIVGNPVTFTAQAATVIAVTSIPGAAVNAGVDFAVAVRLRDAAAANVPLAGVSLTIAIASGGGTLVGTATVVTDATGLATFTINVTGAAGARTFTITGTGLTSATTGNVTIN